MVTKKSAIHTWEPKGTFDWRERVRSIRGRGTRSGSHGDVDARGSGGIDIRGIGGDIEYLMICRRACVHNGCR